MEAITLDWPFPYFTASVSGVSPSNVSSKLFKIWQSILRSSPSTNTTCKSINTTKSTYSNFYLLMSVL